jgi:hypothetical protein
VALFKLAVESLRGTLPNSPNKFLGYFAEMPKKVFRALWQSTPISFWGTLTKCPQNFSGHFEQMSSKLFGEL